MYASINPDFGGVKLVVGSANTVFSLLTESTFPYTLLELKELVVLLFGKNKKGPYLDFKANKVNSCILAK